MCRIITLQLEEEIMPQALAGNFDSNETLSKCLWMLQSIIQFLRSACK